MPIIVKKLYCKSILDEKLSVVKSNVDNSEWHTATCLSEVLWLKLKLGIRNTHISYSNGVLTSN